MRDNDEIRAKVWKVWELGKTDLQYRLMLEELREKEKEYGKVLGTLSEEQYDIVCDYVSLCEAMSWRMLEVACVLMEFPEK